MAKKIEQITLRHDDGEILYWAARARESTGDWEAARNLLTKAIESGYTNAEVHLQRGLVNMLVNEEEEAISDALWILQQPTDVKVEHVVGAVQMLLRLESKVNIASTPTVRALPEEDKLFLIESVSDSPDGATFAQHMLTDLLKSDTLTDKLRQQATSLSEGIKKSHAKSRQKSRD